MAQKSRSQRKLRVFGPQYLSDQPPEEANVEIDYDLNSENTFSTIEQELLESEHHRNYFTAECSDDEHNIDLPIVSSAEDTSVDRVVSLITGEYYHTRYLLADQLDDHLKLYREEGKLPETHWVPFGTWDCNSSIAICWYKALFDFKKFKSRSSAPDLQLKTV